MKKYAPPQAQGMTFSEAGPVPAQGNVAQQIFWYTAFTADMVKPGLPVVNADGTPKWRMAPSPHGAYWKEGMKLGYQDAGSLTLLKSTPPDRRKAAWLYLQFIVSKTVSLKKSHVGLTFIRESDIWDKSFTERAPKLGGLIEFYRSPARVQWTPTGNNVPDYPKLAQLWWQNIGDASSGAKTPQAAMDALAAAQDSVLERLEKSKVQGECGPKLNKKESAEFWFNKSAKDGNIAPQRKLANEKPKGETIDYDTLIKSWPASPPKRAEAKCSHTTVTARLDRAVHDTAASRRSGRPERSKGRERSRPFVLPAAAHGSVRELFPSNPGHIPRRKCLEGDEDRLHSSAVELLRSSPRLCPNDAKQQGHD